MPRDPAQSSPPTAASAARDNTSLLLSYQPLWLWLLLALAAGAGLYLLARSNYVIFHVLVELFSIVLAATVFTIGWNARRMVRSPLFLVLATGFLVAGLVALLHTLTYKGMAVFAVSGSNLSTQLWLVTRLLEAATFVLGAWSLGRPLKVSAWFWLWLFGGAAVLLLATIWPLQVFPVCFVEGSGLTLFKVASEYLVAALLAVAAVLLWRHWDQAGTRLGGLLLAALIFNIASELSFTLYTDPYGTSNFIGHLFKLATIILVYHALVEGTLRTPYSTLFRELTELNLSLDAELRRRQEGEEQLRSANREFSALYRTARAMHSTLRLDALTHLILSMAAAPGGGGFRRVMLFTANRRTGVLQGMLGIDQAAAARALADTETEKDWSEPPFDESIRAAQRDTAFNRMVVKQRLLLDVDDNALARACLERRMVVVEEGATALPGDQCLARELELRRYACAPLGRGDDPFGTLVVDLGSDDEGAPGGRLRFLELFAGQASAALDNARLLHRLESAHRELRDVQEQLIQGEKLAVLGEMAAQVAHELKNPLVSIGGFAQRLVKLDLGNERAGEYAAIIAREVRRLEEMLGNILAFSKKQMVCFEPCDLTTLLAEALELEAEARQGTGIALALEIVAPLPEILGDCRQLRQVVLNLLANARQAMPRGGTLTVRAGRSTLRGEEGVAIEVEDTGGGIPPEIMRNIFNPFFSTHPKGTGIGLSISHRIVEQHHGEIEVRNSAAGACFTVRLPLEPPRFAIR